MLEEISEASVTSSGVMKAASSMVSAWCPSESKVAEAIETTASMKEPQATDT